MGRAVKIPLWAQLAIAEWLPLRKKFLAKKKLKIPALLVSVGPRESLEEFERLDVRSIRRILIGIATAKGLPPYHPHMLRHACATHMHDHGAPIQAVATMLGHAKLSTSQIYARVSAVRMLGRLPESSSACD